MECVLIIASSAALIFARLALAQDLNPFLWGFLAIAVYAGAPGYMIYRGARWTDAAWVWLSSFGGLFALFVVQTIVAERKRMQNRSGPKPKAGKKARRRS
jgi:hypothetical protein